MWVRRSKSDIKRIAHDRNWSPVLPLVLALAAGLCALLWKQAAAFFAFSTAFAFVIIYLYRLIFGDRFIFDFAASLINGPSPPLDQESYFCPSCHKPQLFRPNGCEVCGAALEKMSHWEWRPTAREKRTKAWVQIWSATRWKFARKLLRGRLFAPHNSAQRVPPSALSRQIQR